MLKTRFLNALIIGAALLFFLLPLQLERMFSYDFLLYSDAFVSKLHNFSSSVERLEHDWRFRWRGERVPHSDIVVVDINDSTLEELGQFPFPRAMYADILRRFEEEGVKASAFDIIFIEPERPEARELLERLEKSFEKNNIRGLPQKILQSQKEQVNGDKILGAFLEKSPSAVMAFAFNELLLEQDENAPLLSPDLAAHILPTKVPYSEFHASASFGHILIPVAPLMEATKKNPKLSLGFITAEVDSDSVIRRAKVIIPFQYGLFTSIAIRALEKYKGSPYQVVASGRDFFLENIGDQTRIPVSHYGEVYPNYYGGEGSFTTYELSDVLLGNIPKNALQNKIVFLGVSAVGLKDIRATPFNKSVPGVEVHATIASNALDNSFLVKGSTYFWFGFLSLLLGGILFAWVGERAHPVGASFGFIVFLVLYQLFAQKVFFERGQIVPAILPSFCFALVLFMGILSRYLRTENEKKYVREAFSRYVSRTVVDEILKDANKLRLGGQKKELTVVFCDMVGFTKLSEKMDPAQLTQLLNQFFTRMTNIILKHQGTLDKYMGDAIMCFWGAPIDLADHAKLACRAAAEMLEELERLNKEWKASHGFTIGLRMGINSGEMSVGNMGSEQVFSYTVLGDNVNLGSRLEGVNNIYGTRIIVSERTKELADSEFVFRELDLVAVKGKEQPVKIFELLGPKQSVKENWMHIYAEALAAYRAFDLEKAKTLFQKIRSEEKTAKACEAFLERIDVLEKLEKPKDWDGVWRLTEK